MNVILRAIKYLYVRYRLNVLKLEDRKIYIDMDGVLAQWDTSATAHDTEQPGFFLSRKREPTIVELIKALEKMNADFSILSAVYQNGYAEKEKLLWLLDVVGPIEYTFVPYGDKKADYIRGTKNILIDDFSGNLHDWEASGNVGIKFYNGVNGTHGSWSSKNGKAIHKGQSVEDMLGVIASVR